MKSLLSLFLVIVLNQFALAESSELTHFQSYEANKQGLSGIEDINLYEVEHQGLKKETFKFQTSEKRYELSSVEISRTSKIFDIEFQVIVNLYEDNDSAPATSSESTTTTNGVGRRNKLNGVLRRPIPISLTLRMNDTDQLGNNPCQKYGCSVSDLQFKKWFEAATPALLEKGIKGTYYTHGLKIKSLDYNWATGDWARIVIAETLYHSTQPLPRPHGGGTTVGNRPR